MFNFPGFKSLTTIYQGAESLLIRAVREQDERVVILKTHISEQPSASYLAQLRREDTLLREICSPFIVRRLDWFNYEQRIALVLLDIGAETLSAIRQSRVLTVLDTLRVIHSVARGLCDLHNAGIVHCAINPSNIILNTSTNEVQIIDLTWAISITADVESVPKQKLDISHMVYMAPEQIGQLHNNLRLPHDCRIDLYALGCTFYELLTGHPVFDVSEPRQLFHAHLTRVPSPPSDLAIGIPSAISHIVMKLLEKTPEKRYQTTQSLIQDLELCEQHIRMGSLIPDSFEAGTQDSLANSFNYRIRYLVVLMF